MGLQSNFWELDLFKTIFYLYERARWVGHRNRSPRSQKLTIDFYKNYEGPKKDFIKYSRKDVGGTKIAWVYDRWDRKHHVTLKNLRYCAVSFSQPTLFKSRKTFAQKITYFWYKMRRLRNLEKNMRRTLEQLCVNHLKLVLEQFSVHFWTFRISF